MNGIRRRLVFGTQYDNITEQMLALKLIYVDRITLGDDEAHQDDRARCYRNIAQMRTHFGMHNMDNEFRLAVAAYEARALVLAARETRSSMPETFVVDVTKIIESYI